MEPMPKLVQTAPPYPNLDLIHLARLFLEKYELLAEEDRKLFRGLIRSIANPPMIISKDDGLEFMERNR